MGGLIAGVCVCVYTRRHVCVCVFIYIYIYTQRKNEAIGTRAGVSQGTEGCGGHGEGV